MNKKRNPHLKVKRTCLFNRCVNDCLVVEINITFLSYIISCNDTLSIMWQTECGS